MNSRAQRRLKQMEAERIELTKLLDNPHLDVTERASVAVRLRALLQESDLLNDGNHWLRGTTTTENKDLYDMVQRAIGERKVMKS